LGLARTGRVVTAAALLMAVTFASLVAADVSVMRIFGVGVPLAVLMDATLVRMLLMPAFMRVLGRVNWWAPRPLARLHQRFGISESSAFAVASRPQLRTNDRAVTDAESPAGAVPLHDGMRPEAAGLSS
jgi:RND superfamily putative drug exporter